MEYLAPNLCNVAKMYFTFEGEKGKIKEANKMSAQGTCVPEALQTMERHGYTRHE